MKTKNISTLILFILIPLTVGALSALFGGNMAIYSQLNKPSISPPAILFPIVWTILYILMGISSYLIFQSGSTGSARALNTYKLQLFFNFIWSILFFRFDLYLFSFLWILALIVLIAIMIWQFYQISPLAAGLQLPYLLWCMFAAVLNFMIYRLNA